MVSCISVLSASAYDAWVAARPTNTPCDFLTKSRLYLINQSAAKMTCGVRILRHIVSG